jgi:hypothetical protein
VRLDRDLRAVARLAATPRISTSPSAISGTSSSKSARMSSGSRRERITCGPFVPGANLGDDGLDAAALLVALAVDLLRAR